MIPQKLVRILLLLTLALTSCDSSSKSAPPKETEVEAAIRKIWEKPAAPGLDGAQTVEIKAVKIGRPRKWNLLDGGNGTEDTDLYPVKVHWLLRTHYRTRTHVVERESIFSVFKNGLDEWVASISGNQSEKSYDEPSTMK